jgi:hypothetical protein
LGNPYGIKVRCYWGHFGEQLGNLENPVLIPWKHIGNMMGTRKESKKFLPFIVCMELLFSKLLVTIFCLMAWQGNALKKDKRKNSSPPPLPPSPYE